LNLPRFWISFFLSRKLFELSARPTALLVLIYQAIKSRQIVWIFLPVLKRNSIKMVSEDIGCCHSLCGMWIFFCFEFPPQI
jgi:hypothetical protein